MRITEKIREKIAPYLPDHYATTIASQTGVSEMTVYRTLKGESKNREVIAALIELAHATKKEVVSREQQLNKLIEQL